MVLGGFAPPPESLRSGGSAQKIGGRENSGGARSDLARPWTIDFREAARVVTYARVYRAYEAKYVDGKPRVELRHQFVTTGGHVCRPS